MNKRISIQSEKKEQCGVVGVVSKSGQSVAHMIYQGLLALQHRGQDAAGMAIFNTSWVEFPAACGGWL